MPSQTKKKVAGISAVVGKEVQMASSLTLKIASLESTIVFNLSDTAVAQVLKRFIQDKVTPPPTEWTAAQKNQYYLDAAAAEIKRMVIQEATKVSLREKKAAQASIELEAETENAI